MRAEVNVSLTSAGALPFSRPHRPPHQPRHNIVTLETWGRQQARACSRQEHPCSSRPFKCRADDSSSACCACSQLASSSRGNGSPFPLSCISPSPCHHRRRWYKMSSLRHVTGVSKRLLTFAGSRSFGNVVDLW
nr:hypothetical protein CFP56_34808 [Quercus suber]